MNAIRLAGNKTVFFEKAPGLYDWSISALCWPALHLVQMEVHLSGTRERFAISLIETADIAAGLLAAPEFPHPSKVEQQSSETPKPAYPEALPRVILGNWHEDTPAESAFLGHLHALRVPHLPHWAAILWQAGISSHLIEQLPALGINAWEISGHVQDWSALLQQEVTAGHLTRS